MYDTVVDSVVSLLVSLTTSMSGSRTFGRSKFVTMFVFSCAFLFVMCSRCFESVFECALGRLTSSDGSCCRLWCVMICVSRELRICIFAICSNRSCYCQ